MTKPRLEETGRGLTVRVEDRYLYSRYNPESRAVQAAQTASISNNCIYFVPSPLLGYGLSQLVERIPDNSIILSIEESQELMSLCSKYLLENLGDQCREDSRLVNVRLSDKDSLHALLYSLGPWRFRRVQRIDLSSGASMNPSLYDELTAFLMEDLMAYWRNRHALGRLGREWIRHIFANLTEIGKGKTNFKDIGTLKINRTPMVIAAGPSMEVSLDFIRDNRDHLWLLAVDTAVPALLGSGITPDAIAVLDTQAWNLLDFHGSSNTGIPIIADLTSYPPCLTHTSGDCYIYSSEFAELNFLKRLKGSGLRDYIIPPLGSVGLAAIEIVSRISSGPVFFTGLDFAYSPGKSHARGSSFHYWQITSSSRLNPHPGWEASMKRPRIKAEDAFGTPLSTDSVLNGYASLLKDRYSGDKRYYVLEPGGLNLGLPVIKFTEALRILKDYTQNNSVNKSELESPELNRAAASLFIDEELDRLNRVISAWDSYAEGIGNITEVSESLKGLDEIFIDFPDEPPLPKEDDAFLVRAVSRVRQLQRYIKRLIIVISTQD